MNPNKALWEKGDFTQIAKTMRQSGEQLVNDFGILAGSRVLDLAGGDGTTALPAARKGANVTVIDIARNLVAAGNARVQEEGLTNIHFQEGDATDLNGVADASFDTSISVFGAMFAPKPFDVAQELVRVTKPGGKIFMGNWIPNDPTFVAQLLKTSAAYTPPPPEGFVSPMLWGIESNVLERFTAAGIAAENIHFHPKKFTFYANYSPQHFVAIFRHYYGPTMNAFEAAAAQGKANELQEELEQLLITQNSSATPDTTELTANYLLVEVHR